MDDTEALTQLNSQFIEAFRLGSWELLGRSCRGPSVTSMGQPGSSGLTNDTSRAFVPVQRRSCHSIRFPSMLTATRRSSLLVRPARPVVSAATSTPMSDAQMDGNASTLASGRFWRRRKRHSCPSGMSGSGRYGGLRAAIPAAWIRSLPS